MRCSVLAMLAAGAFGLAAISSPPRADELTQNLISNLENDIKIVKAFDYAKDFCSLLKGQGFVHPNSNPRRVTLDIIGNSV